ncbi:hypothetical protein J6590_047986 [Homalodisca vitripennis]|nr:hypothetical protein J6590_047986 [Homalodisca vitripennis]
MELFRTEVAISRMYRVCQECSGFIGTARLCPHSFSPPVTITPLNTNGRSSYKGVGHTDELFFLFPLRAPGRNITQSDTIFSKQMVKMWTNFVKYLDPTPSGYPVKWVPVTSSSVEYLNIGQHYYVMERAFLQERMAFWNTLPFRNKMEKGRPRC